MYFRGIARVTFRNLYVRYVMECKVDVGVCRVYNGRYCARIRRYFGRISHGRTYWLVSSFTNICCPQIDNIGSTIPCFRVWKLFHKSTRYLLVLCYLPAPGNRFSRRFFERHSYNLFPVYGLPILRNDTIRYNAVRYNTSIPSTKGMRYIFR